jgi:hypothetical protein
MHSLTEETKDIRFYQTFFKHIEWFSRGARSSRKDFKHSSCFSLQLVDGCSLHHCWLALEEKSVVGKQRKKMVKKNKKETEVSHLGSLVNLRSQAWTQGHSLTTSALIAVIKSVGGLSPRLEGITDTTHHLSKPAICVRGDARWLVNWR